MAQTINDKIWKYSNLHCEIYAKILKSYDFAQKIANIKIPAKGIKYADYLNEEDTLKIQTLESQYQVTIKRSSSVNELKEKLSEVLQ